MKSSPEAMRKALEDLGALIRVDIPLPLQRPNPPPRRSPEERKAVSYRKSEGYKALVRHHARKRLAVKLQRVPPWADDDAIRAIYEEARQLEKETKKKYHVDHIYPLQGETVCGLHVHQNLRIIPASENCSKSNKMPDLDECWKELPPPPEPKKLTGYAAMFPNSIMRRRRK